ncbi:hypothetical protein, partial [Streptodolium elevatio]
SSQGTDASFETLSPVSPGVTLFGVSLFLLFFLLFEPTRSVFPLSTRFRAFEQAAHPAFSMHPP